VPLGIQPICERNVMFEMTASFMMDEGGLVHRPLKKIPEFFSFLDCDGYFTIEHGEQIRAWAGGIDPDQQARNLLELGATKGMAGLGDAWRGLTAAQKATLATFKDTLKDQAKAADAERLAVKGDNGAPDVEGEV